MTKTEEKKLGFEVLKETDENIVYKRVLPGNMSAKEKRKREKTLPVVTLHYFDKDDIERLQKIQTQLAEKYVQEKDGDFLISLRAIKEFLLK